MKIAGPLTRLCASTLEATSRRDFLQGSGLGFGALASSLVLPGALRAAAVKSGTSSPFAAKPPHFQAKGKSVIFLFMHGGPSHIDTFDPKPLLRQLDGKPVPASFGKADFQFTKMDKVPIMASPRVFKKRGQSGIEISDLFENVAQHADDLAVIRSCYHDGFTHVTGQNWLNTGWPRVGRPSVGSWVVYGLGSESENLPAYVVMLDGGIKAGAPSYGAGFLPAMYQGTVLRGDGPPILNVNRPEDVTDESQRKMLDLLRFYNDRHQESRAEDTELAARMASYELAFKMQMSVPDVADLSKETTATRQLYGIDDKMTSEFGTQCLMARRLVERGVRFVQLYSGGKKGSEVGWDGHNECNQNHEFMARKVDKPIAGLLSDLKSRGLLESTVVLWGGDFGRTPFTDGAEAGGGNRNGRDHNPYGFSVWMAGGGTRGGKTIGATDEIGLNAVTDRVSMHDLHATLLSLLGVDHKKLTYLFQGRDFRLTDVAGENNLAGRLTNG
ncbi:MAG: DUF1501 domain-containing protein [Bryobacteraceae bacterium]|nr:DUF1501 domain-containing protein [Bryobacteraceae bacterium]